MTKPCWSNDHQLIFQIRLLLRFHLEGTFLKVSPDWCSSSIIFFTLLFDMKVFLSSFTSVVFCDLNDFSAYFFEKKLFSSVDKRRSDVDNCQVWRLVWNHSQKWKSHEMKIQPLVVGNPQFWGRSSKWRFCCVERVVSVWTSLLVWFYQTQWEELLKTWLELLEVVLVGWWWDSGSCTSGCFLCPSSNIPACTLINWWMACPGSVMYRIQVPPFFPGVLCPKTGILWQFCSLRR